MNLLEIMVDQLAAGSPPQVASSFRERRAEKIEAQAAWDGRAQDAAEAPEEEPKDVREAAETLADVLTERAMAADIELAFKVVESSGAIQVEVRESESGRVIRKIPEDEILRLAEQLKAMSGIMLDDLV